MTPPSFEEAHGFSIKAVAELLPEGAPVVVPVDIVKRVELPDRHGDALVMWYTCPAIGCPIHHPGFTMAVSLSYS